MKRWRRRREWHRGFYFQNWWRRHWFPYIELLKSTCACICSFVFVLFVCVRFVRLSFNQNLIKVYGVHTKKNKKWKWHRHWFPLTELYVGVCCCVRVIFFKRVRFIFKFTIWKSSCKQVCVVACAYKCVNMRVCICVNKCVLTKSKCMKTKKTFTWYLRFRCDRQRRNECLTATPSFRRNK
jgi:hypothetical protein